MATLSESQIKDYELLKAKFIYRNKNRLFIFVHLHSIEKNFILAFHKYILMDA